MSLHSLDIQNGRAVLKDNIELTRGVAEEISAYDGPLTITDVSVIPMEFLTTLLENYRGRELAFLGLTSLTPEVAELLSNFKGDLNLNDLEEIIPEVAEYLSRHSGQLDLNGLLCLDKVSGLILSKHSKSLLLESLDVESIDPEVVEAFKHAWPDDWGNV